MMGGLAWLEAVTLSLPLALFYALICLAPWYMCRALTLGSTSILKILEYHSAAAAVAALTVDCGRQRPGARDRPLRVRAI